MRKIFMLCLLVSLSDYCFSAAYSFRTGQFFERIDENNLVCESAMRSYRSEDHLVTVHLIGVNHMALASFYERVSQKIEGKVVVYEQDGWGSEEEERLLSRIKELGTRAEQRYLLAGAHNIPGTKSFGVVTQTCFLSYGKCKEKVLGDLDYLAGAFELISAMPNEFLMALINDKARRIIEEAGLSLQETDDIDEKLYLARDLLEQRATKEFISNTYRTGISKSHEDITRLLEKPDEHDWPEQSIERFTIQRNNKINEAIGKLCARNEKLDIAVVYGSSHMLPVEQYLLKSNFVPIEGSEEWNVVARLAPVS